METIQERRIKNNSSKSNQNMLTGMFSDRDSAENAYTSLNKRGYTKDDINLLMSDDTRKKYFAHDKKEDETELGNKAMEGAGKGSVIGGTVGAIAGVIAALGTNLILPGLGLIIAGPIAAGLAGAGAGGITGGLIGALVGAGIPEDRAKVYESGVKNGKIVMGVKPRNEDDAKFFQEEWQKHKAEELHY